VLDGYTGDQRFFIGWAQVWPRKYREDELRKRLVTDPTAERVPRQRHRAQMPQFAEAFGLKEGDGLYLPPGEQVRVW